MTPPGDPRFLEAGTPPLPNNLVYSLRPVDYVRSVYAFAAHHSEVLSFVPCFCGCERLGHHANDECFIARRSATGKVVEWQPHGVICEVCLDVAHEAMQLHNTGARSTRFARRSTRNGPRNRRRTRTRRCRRPQRRPLRPRAAAVRSSGARTASRRCDLAPDAYARFFEGLHEGVYIGLVSADTTVTIAANRHLRLIFGWPDDLPAAEVRPFDRARFVDDQARTSFLHQLTRDGSAGGYSAPAPPRRQRRHVGGSDGARRGHGRRRRACASRPSSATSTSARSCRIARATCTMSSRRPKSWRLSARRCPASRMS